MQTRLSAADVQPGSDGLLSHWRQHTAVKPFNAHGSLGAGWSIPAGLDANLRDMQRNVRQDGEDGGFGMNEEADQDGGHVLVFTSRLSVNTKSFQS